MIVQKEKWQGIPLLHIYKEEMLADAPTTIFIHGFTSAKEHNLHYAYHLAEQGVRVLLPDAPLHGERAEGHNETALEFRFWEIVMQLVKEVGIVRAELLAQGYTPMKMAVAGTSMGGITTSGCLRKYDWIDTAAICMGVTSYAKFAKHQIEQLEQAGIPMPLTAEEKTGMLHALAAFDLEGEPTLLNNKPIIFWHGMKDTVVPFYLSHDFFMQQQTAGETTNSQFIVDKKQGHIVSREGMLQVTKWLADHLA